jgi:hypothetical protein
MGYDYSSIHVFAQADGPAPTRSRIIDRLKDILPGRPVAAREANRSIVVGPTDRWIFVGDSSGATDDGDPDAHEALIHELSMIAPTLAIHMSDSACVHLYLRHNGELIDKFGTGNFPFYPFNTAEEVASFRGIEDRWAPFTLDATGPASLRNAWDTKYNEDGIVKTTAEVLGIHPELAGCGFSIFDEATEIYFRDWVEDEALLSRQFDEFHFLISKESN